MRNRRPKEDQTVNVWEAVVTYWKDITTWAAVIDGVLILFTIPWILRIKKASLSPLAWCLLVILLLILGPVFCILFVYQGVHRPLTRKRKHRRRSRGKNPVGQHPVHSEAEKAEDVDNTWEGMGRLASR